jgi:hypothetical protein
MLAVIIAVSVGVGISYLPSQTNTTSSSKSVLSHELSIDYVSLRAAESSKFYPTLWSSLFVGSALSQLNASINGQEVYFQRLNQVNVTPSQQGVSVEVRNANLNVIVGNNYTVSYTATFQDNDVKTVSKIVAAQPASTSEITVTGMELCAANCVYPSPFLSAGILVNASVPLSTIQVVVNGTSASIQSYQDNNLTQWATDLKATVSNLPISTGRIYNVTLLATFADGTKSNATYIIEAS